MSNLPQPIVAGYNGYVFSNALETLEARIDPHWDTAQRAVTWKTIRLRLRDIVQADTGVEQAFANIRTILEQPGGALTYNHAGLGGIYLGPGKKDLRFGPKGQVTSFRQLGSGNAIEFTWTVEAVTLDTAAASSGIMEFNYEMNFEIAEDGYTTRTYTGYIVIAMTRANINARQIPDCADNYRERVVPGIPPGFRRKSTYHVSQDKARLDFTIIDMEMPENIPPDFATVARASHRVHSTDKSFWSWSATLSANYELRKGTSPQWAIRAFLDLIQQRVGERQKQFITGNHAGEGRLTFIPTAIAIAENNIYGKDRYEFSFTYRFITDPKNYLLASGLWTPTGQKWQDWATKLHDALGPRGNAGLALRPEDDAIITLIDGRAAVPAARVAAAPPNQNAPEAQILAAVVPKRVEPGKSWLNFECGLYIMPSDEVAVLNRLPQQPVQQQPRNDDPVQNQRPFVLPNQAVPNNAIIQNRANPVIVCILYGSAQRVFYDIQPPQLISVGGLTPVLASRPGYGFWTSTVMNLGLSVTQATWKLRYVLPGVPQTVNINGTKSPTPASILFDQDAQGIGGAVGGIAAAAVAR